ncbi:UDP-N-acetylglucosamine--peptide N-acetylglucosaminyltransferase 110 kDa subunit-like [Daktulosphaira vitifoliae]|uniref:UDP-N-acetylglucosamine--peptide N-acetylglucosaminyltransferase 110 kDa subunit-like n=1 Tax=Daktulosphaira vitifoliae TaxID=58002 RepID=UPI0021AA96D3|nr:UDP-N-acetylglucosamine--peptide N-acetylglucosaminyltransferase 110 kDa subunit-like [Daktulosphaira vitifoliae]
MDIFCEKHIKCEAPITIIAEILSKLFNVQYEKIIGEFKQLGFSQIKDLAGTTLSKASSLSLDGDPLAKLYKAIQKYDEQCTERLKTAKLEYFQDNFTKTKELCEEILSHQPIDLDTFILLAAVHFKCKQYDLSFKYLKEALTQNFNAPEIFCNIGSIYWKKCQLGNALECYYRAICLKKSYIDGWINYVEGLVLAGDKVQASLAYSMILAYKPELYKVRNNFGKLLVSLNKLEEAEYHYILAKKTEPNFSDTWNNLGALYFNNGKIDQAISHFEVALKCNEKSVSAWLNLGLCYLESNDYTKTIDILQKTINLSPDNTIALKYLAHAYLFDDKPLFAIDNLTKCLEIDIQNADLHLELGLIYFTKINNYKEAEISIKHCIELDPMYDIAYKYLIAIYEVQKDFKNASNIAISLGDMHFDSKKYESARNAYTTSLCFNPDNADGHWKLGLTLYMMGHLCNAFPRYRKAIELRPNFPDAYCDLALLYETNGLTQKAIEYYKMAVQLEPYHLNALHNLALLKHKLGHLDDVVDLYTQILDHNDVDSFDLHFELANILYKEMNDLNQSYFHYKRAVEIDNTSLEAYLNMGNILIEMKEGEKAIECFNKAIQLEPNCFIAYTNIGSINKDKENYHEAICSYEMALKIKPDFPDAYCNLVQCLQYICDWSNYEVRNAKLKDIILKQLSQNKVPSLLPHHSILYDFSPDVHKQIALKHADLCIKKVCKLSNNKVYEHPKSLTSDDRIRVGYVSSDFGDHPTSQLMQTIPSIHDRNKVEVYCYSLSSSDNSFSWYKISKGADYFVDISYMTSIAAANQIYNDGIHILVNMNGYTRGARNEIFALRPAPIQVMWLGYPSTSGAPFMDYFISDVICSPQELLHFYTEKVVYLNRSVYTGDHKQIFNNLNSRIITDVRADVQLSTSSLNNFNENSPKEIHLNLPVNSTTQSMYSVQILSDQTVKYYTRQQYNLPEDATVFCNFSQLYKIDPNTLHLWITILNNVPGSVLWLLRFPAAAEENIKKSAKELEFDSSRIIFSDLVPREEHLRRAQLGDIFLDTPLCNGHTTCLDALWAGIPVVTKKGKTFSSRVAASQLTTLGQNDLIANNDIEYISIATKLGINKKYLESVRANIWTLRTESKLFDCKNYSDQLEILYKNVWDKYVTEQSTKHLNGLV